MVTGKHRLHNGAVGVGQHAGDGTACLIWCGPVLRVEGHDDLSAGVSQPVVDRPWLRPGVAMLHDEDTIGPAIKNRAGLMVVGLNEQHSLGRWVIQRTHCSRKARNDGRLPIDGQEDR